MAELKINQIIQMLPEDMAKVFWSMGSDEQAEFFHYLGLAIKKDDAEGRASMQWLAMADETKKRGDLARITYLDFCAFAFDYWPQRAN